jgi:hypothetical protein
MAHSAEIVTDFYCMASFLQLAHSVEPNLSQWPEVHNQICRSGL